MITPADMQVWTVSRSRRQRFELAVYEDCHVVYALTPTQFVEQTVKYKAKAQHVVRSLEEGLMSGRVQRKIDYDTIRSIDFDPELCRLRITTFSGGQQLEPTNEDEAEVITQLASSLQAIVAARPVPSSVSIPAAQPVQASQSQASQTHPSQEMAPQPAPVAAEPLSHQVQTATPEPVLAAEQAVAPEWAENEEQLPSRANIVAAMQEAPQHPHEEIVAPALAPNPVDESEWRAPTPPPRGVALEDDTSVDSVASPDVAAVEPAAEDMTAEDMASDSRLQEARATYAAAIASEIPEAHGTFPEPADPEPSLFHVPEVERPLGMTHAAPFTQPVVATPVSPAPQPAETFFEAATENLGAGWAQAGEHPHLGADQIVPEPSGAFGQALSSAVDSPPADSVAQTAADPAEQRWADAVSGAEAVPNAAGAFGTVEAQGPLSPEDEPQEEERHLTLRERLALSKERPRILRRKDIEQGSETAAESEYQPAAGFAPEPEAQSPETRGPETQDQETQGTVLPGGIDPFERRKSDAVIPPAFDRRQTPVSPFGDSEPTQSVPSLASLGPSPFANAAAAEDGDDFFGEPNYTPFT